MTLEEAIEFNTDSLSKQQGKGLSKRIDALKLGIAALNGYEEGRTKPGGQFFHDLPGETKE